MIYLLIFSILLFLFILIFVIYFDVKIIANKEYFLIKIYRFNFYKKYYKDIKDLNKEKNKISFIKVFKIIDIQSITIHLGGFNDYYYPTLSAKQDEYFTGGKRTGHWLEACATYTPEKVPIWLTISNFFYGYDKDRAYDGDGNEISAKQAYSTYFEIGTYYDFLDNNRISLAVGVTPSKSCYSDYQKKMALCNIDLKYSYNVKFKSGWTVPLSTEFIYNPVFDKPYINFIVNLAF